ncbi:hypothetical protein K504DRAFT_507589 [Pleomassaria siparia CBS 279.74]|uniref:Uncharacterized protein n=1 Tax=Pleomassaria siparia CBS 279.74 TaxID=1314801 RepID=A0A6G1JTX8_9PLEO|nr:hypothetical protein K504DRAFT_507589 [Pleomassaria siparia CBS 279.74]
MELTVYMVQAGYILIREVIVCWTSDITMIKLYAGSSVVFQFWPGRVSIPWLSYATINAPSTRYKLEKA